MNDVIKVKDLPYSRYDVADLERAAELFKSIASEATSARAIYDAYLSFNDELERYSTMGSLAYTRYTLNTRDEFYLAEQNYYDEVGPICSSLITEIADILLDSPYRAELEGIFPETFFPSMECTRKSHSAETVADEQEENSIVTEYSQLMSQIACEFQGEKKPLSYVKGFLDNGDRSVRKEAAFSIGRALEKERDSLDSIYDRLVKVRTRIAKKLGYDNYVPLGYYRMGRIDYNKDMVASFRANVLEDIVPVVKKLKQGVAEALGIEEFYIYDDGVADCGEPRPYPDADGILKAAGEMYHEMSPVTARFIDKMLATEAFDTLSRDGKWGGGYATTFPSYKQAFILANFNGSAGDVDVVTHEFGHTLAFDAYLNREDRSVEVGSMETAETHSMSMEFFAWKYMDKFFRDVDSYKYKHLADALGFIPYGVIVDEFQHIVYENPDMTPSERNDAYLELEKKYRPYLTYKGIPYLEEGTRWQFQMHIYETPFYYIDYCLAQVVALEFLVDSRRDYDDALNRYLEHVKRGGLYPFGKLISLAGLESPFKMGALKDISEECLKILKELHK